LINILFREIG